ncbi:hypothetical protein ACFQGW_15150 [Xanthomonas theicola]|uniref:hypothetical protein n=1 Tax=Xanthomonas theicola TaxID=56464 RepID=UPI0036135F25
MLADWLVTSEVQTVTFDELLRDTSNVPPKALAIPLDWERLPSRQLLREMFSASSVLWMPLASFSSDVDTAKYAVERFSEVDVAEAVSMNRRVLTQLLLAREVVTLSGPDTMLKLRLSEDLQLLCRTRLAMLPDEHATIGNYFEVAMSPTDLSGHVDTELSMSGVFRVDAVLVAKHRELKFEKAASFIAATKLAKEIRQACPLQLSIRDNRIVDGLGPWMGSLYALSGPGYTAITEVAVGTGILPLSRVNWDLNCLLNEGACGIHIGIGNGLNGMHFDFISMEAHLDGI